MVWVMEEKIQFLQPALWKADEDGGIFVFYWLARVFFFFQR